MDEIIGNIGTVEHVRKTVEDAWRGRCKTLGYNKSKRLKMQGDFVSGAVAALQAIDLAAASTDTLSKFASNAWVINVFAGEDFCKIEEEKK